MEANNNAYHAERVNSSLQNAAAVYGREFQEACRTVASLDPRVPGNQQLIQAIWNAPDPGRALMDSARSMKLGERWSPQGHSGMRGPDRGHISGEQQIWEHTFPPDQE